MTSDKFIFFSQQQAGDESPEYDSHIYRDFTVYFKAEDTGSGVDADVQILSLTPSGDWCVIDQRHLGGVGITPVQFSGQFDKLKIAFAGYNVGAFSASVAASSIR